MQTWPLGAFYCAPSKRAVQVLLFRRGKREKLTFFFFSVFWSSVDSNNLTSSCWWEQDSRSMCPKGLFNVIVHDTSANHPLRTHAGTQARAHTHKEREFHFSLLLFNIFLYPWAQHITVPSNSISELKWWLLGELLYYFRDYINIKSQHTYWNKAGFSSLNAGKVCSFGEKNMDELNRKQIIRDCQEKRCIKSIMTFVIDLADLYSLDCL